MRQLLAEYEKVAGNLPRTASRKSAPVPPPIPAPDASPTGLAAQVQAKVGRKLAPDEQAYLKNIGQLFRRATAEGLHYHHDLTGLGLRQNDGAYWDRLELYPSPPRSEVEFWNYLALYLTEKRGQAIPEFMQPVTDLAKARAAMRKHFRARDIEHWNSTLTQLGNPLYQSQSTPTPAATAELRLRFGAAGLSFEWRLAGGGEWTELKSRKIDAFDANYAPGLSAEAALLWLPFWQRAKDAICQRF